MVATGEFIREKMAAEEWRLFLQRKHAFSSKGRCTCQWSRKEWRFMKVGIMEGAMCQRS